MYMMYHIAREIEMEAFCRKYDDIYRTESQSIGSAAFYSNQSKIVHYIIF